MLPTFVIGLREGLEATLIISIIATFLRQNGASLRGMWAGVSAAVVLAIGVGIALHVVDQNLPQRQQEGLETVIGAIAVFFVTGMILWMRTHARYLKRDLESAAGAALADGTTTALVVMAFLAVLREGFETAVFLLSTFNASTDPTTSAAGAVLGLLVSILIGYGIYRGGVKLNLARFFKFTGVFLVFVAAGLVISAFRTAHGTGWVSFGQGTTVDLSWLAPTGAIRTAVISGVLGMPRDPRQVELLAWGLYLVPMLVICLWPAAWKVSTAAARRARLVGAGALAVVALALFLVVPIPAVALAQDAPLDGGGSASVSVSGSSGTLTTKTADATTTWDLSKPVASTQSGADTSWTATAALGDLPQTLDAATLLTYTGNRVPLGLDLQLTPGPFDATWTPKGSGTVLTRDGGLLDGTAETGLVLSLSGGGLTSPRVLTVGDGAAFTVQPAHVSEVSRAITQAGQDRSNRELWKHWFPGFLLVAAAGLVFVALRRRPEPAPVTTSRPTRDQAPAPAR